MKQGEYVVLVIMTMLRIAKLHKKIDLICTVATLSIALAACKSENADNEKNEGKAPQASVTTLADELQSNEPVKLINPSDSASTAKSI